ncbi:hypothetical protein CkaCkLH20_00714 [Colletotrichum karsti]|uniref:Uncharacterized protein n=1 Tax=Colletotrichum karsti TaxID=1095194 RepID=A0A9P6IEX3_9PEZI|nr:uncharacterized protein CkaCkLH20_00714 [Colletotrichum karsti]KAF9881568.1 hypothetical protein CkaCkLH20_00714 [Colletotrichum karsti]
MSAEPIQDIIADFIWGPEEGDRQRLLSKFLAQCAHERYVLSKKKPQADANIQSIINSIKSTPSLAKSAIISAHSETGEQSTIDCVVRMMFMTATKTDYTAFGGFVTVQWRKDETIVDYLDRVYPRLPVGGQQEQPVNTRHLRANVLMSQAGIRIKPTDKLSDHLYLIYGEDFKTLLVFSHRSFLEYSLKKLRADSIDLEHSTAEAVVCGCLPPKLIIETLRTLDFLFPPFGDKKSKKFLNKWVNDGKLDSSLLNGAAYISEEGQPPKDLLGLYEQYPYWGRRLTRLLREVEDPTPITWWQRYTERGRSPRRMFECAVAALIVTAFSAFVATALAAVQVWVAYCDWDGAPSRSWCTTK